MKVAQDQQLATYDGDFCAWLEQQAALIRAGRFDQLDIQNIAEELEGLGRLDKRTVREHIRKIVLRLMTWENRLQQRDASSEIALHQSRDTVEDLVNDSPSLRPLLRSTLLRSGATSIPECP